MTMYLVGSGPADTLDAVHEQFVESAKKRGTRIAVAILGTQDEVGQFLDGYVAPITSRWPEAQVEPIWLEDEPAVAGRSTQWLDDMESLAGIVVCGGLTPSAAPHRSTARRNAGRTRGSA